jgi:threonine aldolase
VDPSLGTPTEVASYLRGHGILVSTPAAGVIRACTHLDVSRQQIAYVADTIRQIEPAMISAMTLVY